MEKNGLKKMLIFISLFCASVFFIRTTGKQIMICAVPLIAAYLISLAVRPAASRISKKFGVRKRFVSAFLVITLILFLFILISGFVSAAADGIRETSEEAMEALSGEDNVIKRAYAAFQKIAEGLSDKDTSPLYDATVAAASAALEKISSFAASAAGSVAQTVPMICLSLIASIIATFYFCVDRGELACELSCFLGRERVRRLLDVKKKIDRASVSYIKSCLVMMLMTFAELTLGFTLIGIRRAPFAAFIISFIDMLPVLGSWTVLIPWGVLSLLAGNAKVGAGLLILEAVVYTVRQFAEPHIVGSIVGVHPMVTLISAFAGYVLLGVPGVIFLPIGAYLTKAVISDEGPREKKPKKMKKTPDG